jgi:Xaa-Pro dipeptidase
MAGSGLEAIVATSPVNVAYLSGYRNRLEVETKEFMLSPGAGIGPAFRSLAAATVGGRRPALAVHALFAAGAVGLGAELLPFGRAGLDFRQGRRSGSALARALEAAQWASPYEALATALRGLGIDDGRIGVELAGLPTRDRRRLAASLPRAELRDCTNLFRILRAVKTGAEIELLRDAGRAAEHATKGALDGAAPEATLDELAARFAATLAEDGAEVDHFAFSPRGLGIAMHSNATLRNEVAYLDYGCIRRLVRSDSGLTVAFRPPDPDLVTRFRALDSAVAAGAERLRPGASTASVWQAMRTEIDGAKVMSSPQGHGIGLEAREYPLIGPSSKGRMRDGCIDLPGNLELEARMVVNLEAATFLPGVASLHVERTFLVGARGSEPLLEEPLDRLLILKRKRKSRRPTTRPNERKAS